jgi:hypothetical protein
VRETRAYKIFAAVSPAPPFAPQTPPPRTRMRYSLLVVAALIAASVLAPVAASSRLRGRKPLLSPATQRPSAFTNAVLDHFPRCGAQGASGKPWRARWAHWPGRRRPSLLGPTPTPRPSHDDAPELTARWLAHVTAWGTLATIGDYAATPAPVRCGAQLHPPYVAARGMPSGDILGNRAHAGTLWGDESGTNGVWPPSQQDLLPGCPLPNPPPPHTHTHTMLW